MIAIVALTVVLLVWFFFLRANPYSPAAGSYCSIESGSSYCYELRDDGTCTLRVKKEGSDKDTTFDSRYTVVGNGLNLDSPNEQIGKRTIFTLQENRLCVNGDCRFVRQ